jgi:hypothetical protein
MGTMRRFSPEFMPGKQRQAPDHPQNKNGGLSAAVRDWMKWWS